VTHDTGQARRLGRDIVFVHRGRLTEKAPAEAFFDRPESPEARAYLNGEIIV
jgi:tungstate transport system ATP-binding protein